MQMTALLWILCVFLSPLLVLLLFWVFFFSRSRRTLSTCKPEKKTLPTWRNHAALVNFFFFYFLLLFDQTINHDPYSFIIFSTIWDFIFLLYF